MMTRLSAVLTAFLVCGLALGCGAETGAEPADDGPTLPAASSVAPLADEAAAGFPAWRIPVAEATPVWSYPGAALDDRPGRVIGLEPELVIGGDSSDPRSLFYRPSDVGVDADGRMYVLDAGNHRVQAFSREGNFVRSFGKRGQGPGEFTSGARLEVVGGRVLVWDRGKDRLVGWDLDGNVIDEIVLEGARGLFAMEATADGASLLVMHTELFPRPSGQLRSGARMDYIVQAYSLTGVPGEVLYRMRSTWPGFNAQRPLIALDGSGRVYVTSSEEYQLHALSLAGEQLWALRVLWERESTAWARDLLITARREREPDRPLEELQREVAEIYPGDHHDALASILVDGHGHLYVIPVVMERQRRDALSAGIELPPRGSASPVDVYTSRGEHLFSGVFLRSAWHEAVGDQVYYFSTDPYTEERTLVRARLIEPF